MFFFFFSLHKLIFILNWLIADMSILINIYHSRGSNLTFLVKTSNFVYSSSFVTSREPLRECPAILVGLSLLGSAFYFKMESKCSMFAWLCSTGSLSYKNSIFYSGSSFWLMDSGLHRDSYFNVRNSRERVSKLLSWKNYLISMLLRMLTCFSNDFSM